MPDSQLPKSLRKLLKKLKSAIAELMADLEAGVFDAMAWQAEMERILARYHAAAYMVGQGSAEMAVADLANVAGYVGIQFEFLNNFRLVVQSAEEFQAGWNARAAMYAEAIKAPYWKGSIKVLPLPAMPGDGTTQCLTNCKCAWDIVPVDENNGDYDCFWVLSPVEHCQTCIERARFWNPLEIRTGRLLIPAGILTVE